MRKNFNVAEQEDMHITQKKCVHVYQEYNEGSSTPYRLYERDDALPGLSFFEPWRVVGEYRNLGSAQESARSRAIVVKDHGLYYKGNKQGMMDWHEPTLEAKNYPEKPSNFYEGVDLSENIDFKTFDNKFLSKEEHDVPVPYNRPKG